jgi:hypothetical protein
MSGVYLNCGCGAIKLWDLKQEKEVKPSWFQRNIDIILIVAAVILATFAVLFAKEIIPGMSMFSAGSYAAGASFVFAMGMQQLLYKRLLEIRPAPETPANV